MDSVQDKNIDQNYKSYISKKRKNTRYRFAALIASAMIAGGGIVGSTISRIKGSEYLDFAENQAQVIQNLESSGASDSELESEKQAYKKSKIAGNFLFYSSYTESFLVGVVAALGCILNKRLKEKSNKELRAFYDQFMEEILMYETDSDFSRLTEISRKLILKISDRENKSLKQIENEVFEKKVFSEFDRSFYDVGSYILKYASSHPGFEEENSELFKVFPKVQVEFYDYLENIGLDIEDFVKKSVEQKMKIVEKYMDEKLKNSKKSENSKLNEHQSSPCNI